jgi:hypothetical protein
MRNVIFAVACLIVIQTLIGVPSAGAAGPTYLNYNGVACPAYNPYNQPLIYRDYRTGYDQTYYEVTIEVPVSSQCYFQQTYCTDAGYCSYPVVPYWWEYPLVSGCRTSGW